MSVTIDHRTGIGACSICGMQYVPSIPEDVLAHRRHHRYHMTAFEPKLHKRFAALLKNGDQSAAARYYSEPDPELVRYWSANWKHDEMYRRAVMFRREFHYDFIQWGYKGETDLDAHGFLFNDDTGVFGHGTIVGACAFRWRQWTNHPPAWAMQWVWLAPKVRRHGILTRHWSLFHQRFGEFMLEQPLSKAMDSFIQKHQIADNRLA